jgi:putative ATP-dependent endonuclease of the OLD family
MYIKKLSIKNYRNFGNPPFIIELTPFTLILGENNVGKTNLLNALGLIFSQEITIFRKRFLELDDINYNSIKAFKANICDLNKTPETVEFPVVQVDVWITDMTEDQRCIAGNWAIDTAITEAQITYTFAPKPGFNKSGWIQKKRELFQTSDQTCEKWPLLLDFPIGEYKYSIFVGNDPSRNVEQDLLQMFKMEFLEALRDAPRELVASSEYRLLYRILDQKDESNYFDIKQTLEELETKIKVNSSLASIKEDVVKLLNRVSLQSMPNDNNIDFNFSTIETSEILKKLGLVYGIDPIDISRNGLGRNNLLYIALLISQLSDKDSRGEKTYFRLIAVEEPESHLHPHLQDHLSSNIEAIRKESDKEMQLLITSHSTHIAAKLRLENTVVMYNDKVNGNCLRSHKILSKLDAKDIETINYLEKYLDATKSRIFFSRKIILVEGFSEQFLVPKFFEIYCNGKGTLEQKGYTVVNVSGLAFKHFLKIIKGGYFIKCLVFTDQDTGTKTENRADDLKRDFETLNLIRVEVTKLSTFEKDVIDANKSGDGKAVLLNSLLATKPTSGKRFKEETGSNDIDIDRFFKEIDSYKSEFAFNLAEQIERAPTKFQLPSYIKNGFDFLAQ